MKGRGGGGGVGIKGRWTERLNSTVAAVRDAAVRYRAFTAARRQLRYYYLPVHRPNGAAHTRVCVCAHYSRARNVHATKNNGEPTKLDAIHNRGRRLVIFL